MTAALPSRSVGKAGTGWRAGTEARRRRRAALPFEGLDLWSVGLLSIAMHLDFRLHEDGAKALRHMGEKHGDSVLVTASRKYRTRTKSQGSVDLQVEIARDDSASLQLAYRREPPPKRTVNFDDVWGRVVYPASSGPIPAFVVAKVELTDARLAALPVRLPLAGHELPEAVGAIEGVRFAKRAGPEADKVYEAWLDVRGERYDLTLVFQREVTQVATAPSDLLRATTELLGVFLPEGQTSAAS